MTRIQLSARSRYVVTSLAVLLAGITPVVRAQNSTVTIQASQPGKAISPDLFGVFFEDLNYAADGRLYAELIQNRSFENSPTEQPGWNPLSFRELQKRGDGDASASAAMKVELAGLAAEDLRATKTVLTGPDADAFNQDGQPPAVKPVSSDGTLKPTFDCEAPANSVTVFRIRK